MRTNPKSPQRKDASDRFIDNKDDILEPDRQVQVLTKRLTEMDEAFSVTLHPRKTRVNDVEIFLKDIEDFLIIIIHSVYF